jgi:3-keto-disaccharide hydrolase
VQKGIVVTPVSPNVRHYAAIRNRFAAVEAAKIAGNCGGSMTQQRLSYLRLVTAGVGFLLLTSFAAAQVESGFTALFNGKNLDGWTLVRATGPGYVVEGDRIVCPADGGGNLFTVKEYANFVLRLEFKLSPGGNNGIGLRAPLEGDAAYQGMEIQVLDDPAPQYKDIRPAQHSGSIYDVFASKQGALKPAGEWNAYEITAQGRQIRIKLNQTVVVDANLDTVTDEQVLKKHPGLSRKSGHIGLLGHRSHVEFRNIRIKELP